MNLVFFKINSIRYLFFYSQYLDTGYSLEIFSGAKSEVDGNSRREQSALSKSTDGFVGQSTPMDRSFENNEEEVADLDISRVEVAEEFQKQQNERLERLWKHQSEQSQKIFEKLDASMTRENR